MWRVPASLGLAKGLVPQVQGQLDYLRSELAQNIIAATGRPVDLLYSRIGLVTGAFFPKGWGDLRVVNLEEDLAVMQQWPPPGVKLDWKEVENGTKDGVYYKLYEACFPTPCVARVYDALPKESRTGRVQLLVPVSRAHKQTPSVALHLAATGDQGFGRRLRLSFPLLKQGVAALVHESPFYGSRRPAAQKGAKLLRVSDLLTLGWATIYESINLLHWLSGEGYEEGGMCMAGLSMGGVHACMTAALYPRDVSVAALLAPRSAAVAYVDGALGAAMAWEPLLREADEGNANVAQHVRACAQPVSVLRAATYALAELELARDVGGVSPTDACASALAAHRVGVRVTSGNSSSASQGAGAGQSTRQEGQEAGGAQVHPLTPAAGQEGHVCVAPSGETTAVPPPQQASHHHVHAGHPHHPGSHTQQPHRSGSHARASSSQQEGQPEKGRSARCLLPISLPSLGLGSTDSQAVLERLERGLSELVRLRAGDKDISRAETLTRLKTVLETYTDITRYPRPRRTDAAVFVAARDDGYVSTESVRALHEYYPGSELRLVSGGHVTAFLMHQDHFRKAILDSLTKLRCKKEAQLGSSLDGQHLQPAPQASPAEQATAAPGA